MRSVFAHTCNIRQIRTKESTYSLPAPPSVPYPGGCSRPSLLYRVHWYICLLSNSASHENERWTWPQTTRSVSLFNKSMRVLIAVSIASVMCFFRVSGIHARKDQDAGGVPLCPAPWTLSLPSSSQRRRQTALVEPEKEKVTDMRPESSRRLTREEIFLPTIHHRKS